MDVSDAIREGRALRTLVRKPISTIGRFVYRDRSGAAVSGGS